MGEKREAAESATTTTTTMIRGSVTLRRRGGASSSSSSSSSSSRACVSRTRGRTPRLGALRKQKRDEEFLVRTKAAEAEPAEPSESPTDGTKEGGEELEATTSYAPEDPSGDSLSLSQ